MIEITVKMQMEDSAETRSFLANLFMPYGGCVPCPCSTGNEMKAETKPIPQAEQKAEGPQPTPEKAAKSEAKPAPQPEPEKAEQKAEDPKPAATAKKYKTEDVRAAMASKLADHRVDLVNKLKDMGAKNVSSLPEDKYEEFINFCNSL